MYYKMKPIQLNRNMYSDQSPGLALLNVSSMILFGLGFVFHKLSQISFTAHEVYYALQILSVLMIITINAPKFIEQIGKKSKKIKTTWKNRRK